MIYEVRRASLNVTGSGRRVKHPPMGFTQALDRRSRFLALHFIEGDWSWDTEDLPDRCAR